MTQKQPTSPPPASTASAIPDPFSTTSTTDFPPAVFQKVQETIHQQFDHESAHLNTVLTDARKCFLDLCHEFEVEPKLVHSSTRRAKSNAYHHNSTPTSSTSHHHHHRIKATPIVPYPDGTMPQQRREPSYNTNPPITSSSSSRKTTTRSARHATTIHEEEEENNEDTLHSSRIDHTPSIMRPEHDVLRKGHRTATAAANYPTPLDNSNAVWNRLYQHGKEKQHARWSAAQSAQYRELIAYTKEQNELTFHPQICRRTNHNQIHSSGRTTSELLEKLSRSCRDLEKEEELRAELEVRECTFHPQIVSSSNRPLQSSRSGSRGVFASDRLYFNAKERERNKQLEQHIHVHQHHVTQRTASSSKSSRSTSSRAAAKYPPQSITITTLPSSSSSNSNSNRVIVQSNTPHRTQIRTRSAPQYYNAPPRRTQTHSPPTTALAVTVGVQKPYIAKEIISSHSNKSATAAIPTTSTSSGPVSSTATTTTTITTPIITTTTSSTSTNSSSVSKSTPTPTVEVKPLEISIKGTRAQADTPKATTKSVLVMTPLPTTTMSTTSGTVTPIVPSSVSSSQPTSSLLGAQECIQTTTTQTTTTTTTNKAAIILSPPPTPPQGVTSSTLLKKSASDEPQRSVSSPTAATTHEMLKRRIHGDPFASTYNMGTALARSSTSTKDHQESSTNSHHTTNAWTVTRTTVKKALPDSDSVKNAVTNTAALNEISNTYPPRSDLINVESSIDYDPEFVEEQHIITSIGSNISRHSSMRSAGDDEEVIFSECTALEEEDIGDDNEEEEVSAYE